MKLVADLQTMEKYIKSLSDGLVELKDAYKTISNEKYSSGDEEVDPVMNEARSSLASKLQSTIDKQEKFIDNLNAAVKIYRENEEDLITIDVSEVSSTVENYPEITNFSASSAASKLTGLKNVDFTTTTVGSKMVTYDGTTLYCPVGNADFVISDGFGWRICPFHGSEYHEGLDLAGMPTGTPLTASISGKVVTASHQGGYGNCVVIDDGTTTVKYAHLSRINVNVGDQVKLGDKVGELGSTGSSTGPHLHFEVTKNGEIVNPAPYIGVEDDPSNDQR